MIGVIKGGILGVQTIAHLKMVDLCVAAARRVPSRDSGLCLVFVFLKSLGFT